MVTPDLGTISRNIMEKDKNALLDPEALTPWEIRDGRWYKREDYHRNSYGVNGAKFRACRHLITQALKRDESITHIVSAQSVRSPQAAITATLAEELGLGCTIVVGASKPETAINHPSVRIAVEAGAQLDTSRRVAYNPVIQPYAAELAEVLGAYQVPYAISPPEDASASVLEAFMGVGGYQVSNVPRGLETLVIAFGSANTTTGVLYGLTQYGFQDIKRIVLVGVGPDRRDWMHDKLDRVFGLWSPPDDVEIEYIPLQGWFAEYADSMPETVDDIILHPTYEGKVARFLNSAKPDWWTRRDGSTGFWIVGGPL